MGYKFLSQAWFEEVSRIRDEFGEIEVPEAIADLSINLQVTDGPDGRTVIAHFTGLGIAPGHASDAPTTITVPYEVTRRVFVERDQTAGMQAFMSGQIQIDGDMSKLMAMQGASGLSSPEATKMVARIAEMTE